MGENNSPTYKDFKIGQVVTCVEVDDFEHLQIGEQYKIVDLESILPDAICIQINPNMSAFFKIKHFCSISGMRINKINKILGNED
jgi:hypothetical protein